VRTLRVCPQCGSDRIYYEAGMITGEKYHCYECDYVGSLVLEKEMDEEEFEDHMPEPEKPKEKKPKRKWFRRT
jgi:hypothetical protein